MDFIHHVDQFEAQVRDISPTFKTYYDALVKAGFTPTQAFVLTREFHTVWWSNVLNQVNQNKE